MTNWFVPVDAFRRYWSHVFGLLGLLACLGASLAFAIGSTYYCFKVPDSICNGLQTSLSLFCGLLINLLVLLFGVFKDPPSQAAYDAVCNGDKQDERHHVESRRACILNAASAIYVAILLSAACLAACTLAPWVTSLEKPKALGTLYFIGAFSLAGFALHLWKVLFWFMSVFFYDEKMAVGKFEDGAPS